MSASQLHGGMQLAALVLLLLYLLTAALLLPREATFLRGVQLPHRRLFIAQDVLMQLCILATLLPCVIFSRLGLAALYTVLVGFAGMWFTAIWAAVSRYSYTYRILLGQKGDLSQRLKEIFDKVKEEDPGER